MLPQPGNDGAVVAIVRVVDEANLLVIGRLRVLPRDPTAFVITCHDSFPSRKFVASSAVRIWNAMCEVRLRNLCVPTLRFESTRI